MIVLHLLQLNGSVNYYRKWKLISSEVEVKLKNRENSKFSKIIKLWSKFTRRTCVPCICLRAPLFLKQAQASSMHKHKQWNGLMIYCTMTCHSYTTQSTCRHISLCSLTVVQTTSQSWLLCASSAAVETSPRASVYLAGVFPATAYVTHNQTLNKHAPQISYSCFYNQVLIF